MKMLKNKGRRMEPWGTPVKISCHLLNLFPTFVCFYLWNRFGLKLRRIY